MMSNYASLPMSECADDQSQPSNLLAPGSIRDHSMIVSSGGLCVQAVCSDKGGFEIAGHIRQRSEQLKVLYKVEIASNSLVLSAAYAKQSILRKLSFLFNFIVISQ